MASQLNIVAYLKENGPCTTGQLMAHFGNRDVSTKMSRLRKQGYAEYRIIRSTRGNTSLWWLTEKGESLRT